MQPEVHSIHPEFSDKSSRKGAKDAKILFQWVFFALFGSLA